MRLITFAKYLSILVSLAIIFLQPASVSASADLQAKSTLRCTANNCKLTPANQPFFSVRNAVPAFTQQRTLTAINLRDDACALSTTVLPPAQEYSLPLERIFIAVRSIDGQSYLGDVQDSSAQSTVSAAKLATSAHIFGYLKPGESTDFIWYATIDPTLGNQYQGTSLDVTIQLQMRCNDPDLILPKPKPTSTITSLQLPLDLAAPTGVETDFGQVLGARSESPNCPLTPLHTLAANRISPDIVEIHWSGSLDTATIAFQNLHTESIFRHRGVRRSPYSLKVPQGSYTFWLETETVCGDQVVSSRLIVSSNNPAAGTATPSSSGEVLGTKTIDETLAQVKNPQPGTRSEKLLSATAPVETLRAHVQARTSATCILAIFLIILCVLLTLLFFRKQDK